MIFPTEFLCFIIPSMTKAVIFDIDDTLVKGNSWIAITEAMGASVENHRQFYRDMLETDGDGYEDAKRKLIRMWAESGKNHRRFFEDLYDSMPLRENAREIIDFLKGKGIASCLITGSTNLYAEIVARKLGVGSYFANATFVWGEDDDLTDFIYFKDQGKKKLEQFEAFCKQEHLTPEECIAIGDGENDIGLFKTMRGVVFKHSDSEELKKLSWKTISDLSELKQFV